MNKIYLKLFLVTIVIFLFFRLPYRSFIYDNGIFDFYIADTSPNFFTVFLFVFYKKWQKTTVKNITLCLATFLGLSIYELFIQKYMSIATVDYNDIIASFVGCIVAYYTIQKMDTLKEQLVKIDETSNR